MAELFDDISRLVGGTLPRRQVLKLVGGAVLGAVFASSSRSQVNGHPTAGRCCAAPGGVCHFRGDIAQCTDQNGEVLWNKTRCNSEGHQWVADGSCCADGRYCNVNEVCCGSFCCDTESEVCIAGVCCPLNRACDNNTVCCAEGEQCLNGETCCPANRLCNDNTTCCPAGSVCFGGDACCGVVKVCNDGSVCCPEGQVCCGGVTCCASCQNGRCSGGGTVVSPVR